MISFSEVVDTIANIKANPELECFIVIMPVSKIYLSEIDKPISEIEQILINAVSDKLEELYNEL